MIALLQRVNSGSVSVNSEIISHIYKGLVVFLGVFDGDSFEDAKFLAEKTANLRIFDDSEGIMNLSLLDCGGEALCVSQFTLCANARKGRRPSFSYAMPPEPAEKLYNSFCEELALIGITTQKGLFGAHMLVDIKNDGPVTIILNSKETRRGNLKNNSSAKEGR
ncbi:D-tyrosyl-tRNA(Tyr) deacylase [bacterium]|nr:D-tyrosyl-tRNA(Tyr) deacylase [bacterium]